MGKLFSNKSVGDLQGKVGNLVFVHRADGVVIVRRSPVRQADWTPPQKASQGRFAQASLYRKRLKQQPEEYAPYVAVAKLTHKRACDLVMADFLNPPEVKDVDLSSYTGKIGEPIRVEAVDDFGVNRVGADISKLDGTLLEQGAAVMDDATGKWVYLTQTAVSPGQTVVIRVTASDRPGNVVTKTLYHALVAHG